MNRIAISSISLAEIVYLVEKRRLPEAAYEQVVQCFADPLHVFIEVPFTGAIAAAMRQVPRETVPDMPDRMVAATAIHLNVPVLSRDRRILAASLETIW